MPVGKYGVWYIRNNIRHHIFDYGDSEGKTPKTGETQTLDVVVSDFDDMTQRSQRMDKVTLTNVEQGEWIEEYSTMSAQALAIDGYGIKQIRCEDGRLLRQYMKDNIVRFQAVHDAPGHVGEWKVQTELFQFTG